MDGDLTPGAQHRKQELKCRKGAEGMVSGAQEGDAAHPSSRTRNLSELSAYSWGSRYTHTKTHPLTHTHRCVHMSSHARTHSYAYPTRRAFFEFRMLEILCFLPLSTRGPF